MMQDFLRRIQEAVRSGDLDTAELLFLEEAEEPWGNVALLREAARCVAEAGERDRAAEMLAGLQEAAREEGSAVHLDLLRQLCLCVPHREAWRQAFVTAFSEYHAGAAVDLAYLKAVDITSSHDLDEAFSRLDILLRLHEGAYVDHPGGWGIGKIRSVAPLTGHMVVDLAGKRGHRVNIGAAATIFRPIPADHFSAILFDRAEELRARAEEDPGEVVRLLLRSFGSPQAISDLCDRLVPDVVQKERWSGWWSRARSAVKSDPYLKLSGSPRPRVELLAEPVSELDDILAEFREGTVRTRLATVRRFKSRKDDESRRRIVEALAELKGGTLVSLEVLLLRVVLEEIDAAEVASFLLGRDDGPDLVRRLQAGELSREAVRAVGATAGFDQFTPYFLGAEAATIDTAAHILREKDEQRFLDLLEEIFAQPRRHPWPLFWMGSVRTEPLWEDFLVSFPSHDLLLRHLGLLDFLFRADQREKARAAVAFGISVLTRAKLKTFRAHLERTPRDSLPEVLTQVEANRAFKDLVRASMMEQVGVLAPDALKKRRRKTETSGIDENIIYVTEAGLRKRQEEYQILVQEKIPQVIEEVGRAQEFGDLSENAEWTAALEKRDHLAARAQEMEAELKQAAVISTDFYQPGRVSLGCEVTVRNMSDNTTESWRLLGPWDGDLSAGVLNYKSPIGRSLLGHQKGDVVTAVLPDSSVMYEILAVGPCRLD